MSNKLERRDLLPNRLSIGIMAAALVVIEFLPQKEEFNLARKGRDRSHIRLMTSIPCCIVFLMSVFTAWTTKNYRYDS